MADVDELKQEQKARYHQVYCGICRRIREQSSGLARLTLSYDMVFLALLLMSLYEPEDTPGSKACGFHPIKPRAWLDNPYIQYAADMNVVLAYYKAMDDCRDEHSLTARAAAAMLKKSCPEIEEKYPRQCRAVQECISQLGHLEQENCMDPDQPAGCFGRLMGELLVYREDMWASALRQMGYALGRFVYLADAAIDYRADKRKHRYNPYLAMGTGEDWNRWEQYLIMAMGRCAEYYESLPLVQDKEILDNILYSGVWIAYRGKQKALKKSAGGSNDR